MVIIAASDLVKQYGSQTAVDGIGFQVRKGELFGFLGPNGAGKTTTMRMIQCISPRTSGTLTVLGMDPNTAGKAIRARMGVVPQETNLDTELTVFENLVSYASYFDISKKQAGAVAEQLLESFQLIQKRDVNVDLLSGGMKRRLLLARAMMSGPELFILDEPSIGLDPQARHDLWDRLVQLKAQGKTIVLTTHYLDEASRLCDRLVIMDQGTIIAEGSPGDLVDRYIGMDIVETERSESIATILNQHEVLYEEIGEQIQVKTKNPREIMDLLMEGETGIRVTTRPASLEDVFLLLTGRTLRE